MNDFSINKNGFRRGSTLANFSLVLSLVSCVAAGYLYFQWNSVSSEKKGFEAVRIQLEDQIASLETDLQSSLKEQQKLKQVVEIEGNDKAKTLAELAETKASLEQLQADLKKIKNERDSLKKLAVQMKSKTSEFPALPSSASSVVQNGVSAASALTAQLKASSNQPSDAMKVKTINRNFNFVVFDLVPGVVLKVGDAAVVERDGRWISDLKIKQIYAQFASAEIRKESEDNLVQVGDSVKRV